MEKLDIMKNRQGFIAALEADKIMYDILMKMGLTKPKSDIEN